MPDFFRRFCRRFVLLIFVGKSAQKKFSRKIPGKIQSNLHNKIPDTFLQRGRWAAANGGVTNGGLRGVWPPFLEIGRNRPFSPFFCLFRPFPGGAKSTWKIQKTEEKDRFPQISSDLLKPPSLKPPFAAPQGRARKLKLFRAIRSAEVLCLHLEPSQTNTRVC